MDKLQMCLDELTYTAKHPKAMLDKYLAQGKKCVGVLPIYNPEELIHAAGMVPLGLWGAQMETVHSAKYFPAFICSIMHSVLELAYNGNYDGLSAIIVPIMCDTFRGISQSLRTVTKIPVIAYAPAQNRTDPGEVDYMMEEYKFVKKRIEETCGVKVSMDALYDSIAIYNEHNAVMREFASVANEHLDIITPKVRHHVMKSAHFMLREEHTALVKTLIDELRKLPAFEFTGKRIVLSGITAEPDELLDILEEYNFAVVGDDLCQESRQYRTDIPSDLDQLRRLVHRWNAIRGDACVHEVHSSRSDILKELVAENKADGVIACIMKFCDPEQYNLPLFTGDLTDAGIPYLTLDIDQSSNATEQFRTRIQTFSEVL